MVKLFLKYLKLFYNLINPINPITKIRIFNTFAHLKRRFNDKKNIQKCKNLVITHREMCMKS